MGNISYGDKGTFTRLINNLKAKIASTYANSIIIDKTELVMKSGDGEVLSSIPLDDIALNLKWNESSDRLSWTDYEI
jgi:hypothetical protein